MEGLCTALILPPTGVLESSLMIVLEAIQTCVCWIRPLWHPSISCSMSSPCEVQLANGSQYPPCYATMKQNQDICLKGQQMNA